MTTGVWRSTSVSNASRSPLRAWSTRASSGAMELANLAARRPFEGEGCNSNAPERVIPPVPRPSTLDLRAELLRDARAILEREYAEDLQLDDVATRIATSRRQLQRVFTEIGGRSFR